MFAIKKALSLFLYPFTLILLLLIAAAVLSFFTSTARWTRVVLVVAVTGLLASSSRMIVDYLIVPLELNHPPLDLEAARKVNPRWIVVLAGGHTPDPWLPVSSRLFPPALVRLVEGIRLQRELPGTTLLLSGGNSSGPQSEAATLRDVALSLGVAPDRIRLESQSLDTDDQAVLVHDIVKDDRFILVTSASHMVRAVKLFRKAGMDPIPAPTDYLAPQDGAAAAWFPTIHNQRKLQTAVHEYAGIVWGRILGRID